MFAPRVVLVSLAVTALACGTSARQQQPARRMSSPPYANYTEAAPWPLPKTFTRHDTRTIKFGPGFAFRCGSGKGCLLAACQTVVLTAAFERYRAVLTSRVEPASTVPQGESVDVAVDMVDTIEVCVASDDEVLTPDVDESYSFTLSGATPSSSVIRAQSVFGALRGFETLAQLVSIYTPGTVFNTPVEVSDHPEYSYRGMMIDPAITYLPPSFFEHLFDGMSMNHMNVLHVHWTDIASFPIVSEAFPALSKGAYDPAAVYTADMLRSIVEGGRLRGIRVIAEWDMPGHGGWFYGMPELCLMSCPSVLDVTSDAVYEFLTAFLTEMAQIFVDPVMMLGGDEVGLDTRDPVTGAPLLLTCFDLDPKASAWLKSHDMLSANVTAYFWKRVTTEVVPKVNRTAMVWFGMPSTGDPPLAQLPASTIANVWGAAEWANYSIHNGHPTVLSVDSWWYLPPYDGSGGGGAWPEAYLHDPCDELACDTETRKFVLGGSVAEWGSSAANFDGVVWPGAMAAAERLWVGSFRNEQPPVVDSHGHIRRDILDRLAVHSCRMALRGVHVGFYTGTGSLGGTTHWPVGKPGDFDFVPRAACPSDWITPSP